MRISDWSSDVCSSDLDDAQLDALAVREHGATQTLVNWDKIAARVVDVNGRHGISGALLPFSAEGAVRVVDALDRKSVVSGQSVSVRVDLGGRRIIKKKNRATV